MSEHNHRVPNDDHNIVTGGLVSNGLRAADGSLANSNVPKRCKFRTSISHIAVRSTEYNLAKRDSNEESEQLRN